MLKTLLIDPEIEFIQDLESRLKNQYPSISICAKCLSAEKGISLIEETSPELVFIEMEVALSKKNTLISQSRDKGFEVIFTSNASAHSADLVNYQVSGFLVKPCSDSSLKVVVENAQDRLHLREKKIRDEQRWKRVLQSLPINELIGIPTIEGFEFIKIEDIIRCEGLQKCTRIITADRSDIISSYHIGKFRTLLAPFHFFSPHKSHIINMRKIIRYYKEGTIIMKDKSAVPVSRRKKVDFLGQLKCLLR